VESKFVPNKTGKDMGFAAIEGKKVARFFKEASAYATNSDKHGNGRKVYVPGEKGQKPVQVGMVY